MTEETKRALDLARGIVDHFEKHGRNPVYTDMQDVARVLINLAAENEELKGLVATAREHYARELVRWGEEIEEWKKGLHLHAAEKERLLVENARLKEDAGWARAECGSEKKRAEGLFNTNCTLRLKLEAQAAENERLNAENAGLRERVSKLSVENARKILRECRKWFKRNGYISMYNRLIEATKEQV